MSIELPTVDGGFNVICSDPPWNFKARGENGDGRSPDYDLMSLDDIASMPVEAVAAKDCHLFLWVTGPHLPHAFDIMRAWGFRYSGMAFTWVKLKRSTRDNAWRYSDDIESSLHVGMGYTTRKNAEFCLLGRRGTPKRISAAVREVIVSPVRAHSRKPDEFFGRVESYAEGPYLELFARESRPGWITFGNEATKFDAVEAEILDAKRRDEAAKELHGDFAVLNFPTKFDEPVTDDLKEAA